MLSHSIRYFFEVKPKTVLMDKLAAFGISETDEIDLLVSDSFWFAELIPELESVAWHHAIIETKIKISHMSQFMSRLSLIEHDEATVEAFVREHFGSPPFQSTTFDEYWTLSFSKSPLNILKEENGLVGQYQFEIPKQLAENSDERLELSNWLKKCSDKWNKSVEGIKRLTAYQSWSKKQ